MVLKKNVAIIDSSTPKSKFEEVVNEFQDPRAKYQYLVTSFKFDAAIRSTRTAHFKGAGRRY